MTALRATYVRIGDVDPDASATYGDLVRVELVYRYLDVPDELATLTREQLGPGRLNYVWGGVEGWWTTAWLRRPLPHPDHDPRRPTSVRYDPVTRDVVTDNPRWLRWPLRLRYDDLVTVLGYRDDPDGGRIEVRRPGTGETFR